MAIGSILPKVSYEALNSYGSKIERTKGEKALERVIDRLFALSTYSRPQDLIVFFRNLIFTHKLLDLAEKESKRLGRKVNISYQIGAGHSGVEDFLILGKGVCEKLLSCYSKEIWEDVINMNRGIDNVVSIIILKSKEDGDGTALTDWQLQPTLVDEDLENLVTSKMGK